MENNKNSFEAGKAVGKNQEKGANLMDQAGNAAVSAKESVLGAGKAVQDTAQAGVDYVKGAVAPKNVENNKNSFEAGKAVGKNEEKGATLMDQAGNAAIYAKDSVLGAGKVVQDTAQGGIDYVKGAVAPKK